ncbi:hypothetical protein ACFWPV_09855 [Streptomyces uncialis]|uniref:hypothetical protein n=1 Tax=Streptomyces uncialis TaxID=1048205 RepID=UPI003646D5FE
MMARRPDPDDPLADLVQGEQTDEVQDLEHRAAIAALGDLGTRFTDLSRRSLTAWVTAFGSPDAPPASPGALRRLLTAVRAAVRRLLGPVASRASAALTAALTEAVRMGARQHAAFIEAATARRTRPAAVRPSRALRRRAAALAAAVAERRDRALALLRPARVARWTDVQTGIGVAGSTVPAVRAHISTAVNEAVGEAGQAAIDAVGALKVWVAERDACVNCAAYAGHTVPADGTFPPGLSFDPNQRGRGTRTLTGPPLHPHCRCRTVAWDDTWAQPGVTPFPDAMRREARRSIARGWSLPTESGAARIRAARDLLRAGSGLPRSVDEFAAQAVRAGRFTDRNVPTGP